MHFIHSSDFISPLFLFNGHLQTIYPALFRKIDNVPYTRERITTPDDDFLDLDWSCLAKPNGKLVIISHGMEGDSQRPYVKGMVKAFNGAGYDALAWNYRSCSGELNLQPVFYHSGATHDLDLVVRHALKKNYKEIVLIGFSLGGNLTLKYVGEQHTALPAEVTRCVALSVPIDLNGCSYQMAKPINYFYNRRFLQSLKNKVKCKAAAMPDRIDVTTLNTIKTIREFDNNFTAPIHGFKDVDDYYSRCSAIGFLDTISIPTLMINAKNDSFLSASCYLNETTNTNPHLFIETPAQGGHCGFRPRITNQHGLYWSEKRAIDFVTHPAKFIH